MSELFRETLFGHAVRFLTDNQIFQYPEERTDFEVPPAYSISDSFVAPHGDEQSSDGDSSQGAYLPPPATVEKVEGQDPADVEGAFPNLQLTSKKCEEKDHTIIPAIATDGTILVDWYSSDDPANPQNWSSKKKAFVTMQICFYTFAVYLASAIYTPSEPGVMRAFGVGPTAASLGLALYVLGYGVGPLLWSPMSEIPIIGRNPPYLVTFAIFVVLCVPTIFVNNFPGFLVLRFLQGYFGSPCLATGGASVSDMYSLLKLPYVLTFWVAAATCGPALGPLLSGFSVVAENWRWSLWETLWVSGPVFLLLFCCLPETSTPNILLRRARRLRKLTGQERLRSQSEIDQSKLTVREVTNDALWKPMQILIQDPAITFAAGYTSLVYGIYYSFFEVCPLVYIGLYHFNYGQMGLTFLSIAVSTALAVIAYFSYLYFVLEPNLKANGFGPPEQRLVSALYASFLLPAGLFLFGWTANGHIHWMVGVVGIGIYGFGIFIVLQCIFLYVPLSYPQYAASLFAGNDFTRSAVAAGAILFARPLYLNLGIGQGVSLLAGFTVACVGGIWLLYFCGARLRARSRFAVT